MYQGSISGGMGMVLRGMDAQLDSTNSPRIL